MAGRPTKDTHVRDTQINLRISTAEKAEMAEMAESLGITLSDLLLDATREQVRKWRR